MKIRWSPAATALARRYLRDQDGMRAIGVAVAVLADDPYPPEGFHRGRYHRLRDELIPLTAGEARRLFCLYTHITRLRAFHEHWSNWRRRGQARARRSHYARRTEGLRTLL